MATAPAPVPNSAQLLTESHMVLSRELRRLTRAATFVALMTSPFLFYWFHHHEGWSVTKSILITFLAIVVFRGLVDILVRRVIPWPSLFGTEDARLREEDITNRRRAWTWRFWLRLAIFVGGLDHVVFLIQILFDRARRRDDHLDRDLDGARSRTRPRASATTRKTGSSSAVFQIFFLFFANFLIFMGPLLLMGISQIRGYEPGDAEWGVKLDHVRGQAEAKEEIRRVVTLWQSGEVFESAGRQARARPALPRRAGHRQDDDGEGDRDRLQLAVRLDPGLGLRADVHRHRRHDRPLPRAQGEEARPQVGRPVHRLHRRDRRGRHAAAVARRARPA